MTTSLALWLAIGAGVLAILALAAFWAACTLLVVDHYKWNADREAACRPWAEMIMVIDDLADRQHDCDLLADPTYGRLPAAYASLVPESAVVMTGAHLAPLRQQFWAKRRSAMVMRRRPKRAVERLLISLGMGDEHDLTSLALDAIAASRIPVAIDVVLSAAAPGLERVHDRAKLMPQRVHMHVGVEDMASLIEAADLAIGAAGTSSWE